MASVDDGKRRLRFESSETHALREALFAALRSMQTYRNAVVRLERLWKQTKHGRHDNRLFYELAQYASDDPALRIYVDEFQRVVVRDLRIAEPHRQSEPATWACNFLHCDVEPSSGKGPPSPDVRHVALPPRQVEVWTEQARVALVVSPRSARIQVFGDDDALADECSISGDMGYGDPEWKQLADRAHAMLDKQLDCMRHSFERNNASLSNFHFRNPGSQRAQREDMMLLATWLLGNKTPDRNTRERLRKHAKLLGITFPPPPR